MREMKTAGIKISTQDGERIADGVSCGAWAATKMTIDDWLSNADDDALARTDEIWTVTHVASGLSIQRVGCRYLGVLDAMRVADLLSKRMPFTRVTEPLENADDERCAVEAVVAEALALEDSP